MAFISPFVCSQNKTKGRKERYMAKKPDHHTYAVVQIAAGHWPDTWVLTLSCGHTRKSNNRLTRAKCRQCPEEERDMTRADNIGREHPFPWQVHDHTPGRFYAACEVLDATGKIVASHMKPGIAETIAQAVNAWAERERAAGRAP